MPCTAECEPLTETRGSSKATRIQHGPNPEHSRLFPDIDVWREQPPTVTVQMPNGSIVGGSKLVMDWLVELHEYLEGEEE